MLVREGVDPKPGEATTENGGAKLDHRAAILSRVRAVRN